MTVKKKGSVRRRSADELEFLLGRLTTEQLLDLAAAAAPSKSFDKTKNKPQLLQDLKAATDGKRLALAAHRLEALSPFKHVYLLRFDGQKKSGTFASLQAALNAKYQRLLEAANPVDLSKREMQLQCAVIDQVAQRIYIKLCHPVPHFEWVETDDTTRELDQYRQRHPVVFCLRPQDSFATVSFPGFSQGSGTPDSERISYESICNNAIEMATEVTGLSFHGVQLKGAIDRLVNEKPSEVVDVHRSVKIGEGSANVYAGETGSDVGTVLSKMFGMKISAAEIRVLLSQEEAKNIALFWKNSGHFTRVGLAGHAPEILFIWKSTASSGAAVEYTLNRFMRAVPEGIDASQLYNYLEDLPGGEMVWTSQLMQKFGLDEQIVLRLLSDAVRKNSLRPKFRIKTDAILSGYSNDWRDSLRDSTSQQTISHRTALTRHS